MKIALVWQGLDGRYGHWRDGLWAAMKELEKEHLVKYFDFPLTDIDVFKPDVVLYWEAPITQRGKDAVNWQAVCALPYKKALLFAGGPLVAYDVKDFDLVFVESLINEEDCERQSIPFRRAFGVNTKIFNGHRNGSLYVTLQATFAGWKRHELFAESTFGIKDIVPLAVGRKQEHDLNGYNRCKQLGIKILEEQPAEEVAKLLGSSLCVLNTAEFWGGGQRCTLEAMAMAIPVIVMSDSPKNREFVEESGGGYIVEPDAQKIRYQIEDIQSDILKYRTEVGNKGREYVMNNWTHKHYARAILEGILSICE